MKKYTIGTIAVIIIIVSGYFVYRFFNGGLIKNEWSICENGFYSRYPKGIMDANATYYDLNNNEIGSCGFWTGNTQNCLEIRQKVGKCTGVSSWRILFTKGKI
ncbi:MAG: hypothetical protein Q7S43_00330 [bacterium]|nr:hypothetical protein [bacterium]